MYVPKKSKRETHSEILFPLIISIPLGEFKEHPEQFLYFSESNYFYLTQKLQIKTWSYFIRKLRQGISTNNLDIFIVIFLFY